MSEQVLVSRDALEMLLRNHTVFGDYPQNYDTFCASCGRPKPFADQPGTHEHTCPVPSLRAALTAPAPAESDELRAEVTRLEGLLRLAGPALRAAQTYHYKRAHAAHALPGSRDRAGYEIEANEALFRLRLNSSQKGAAAVLDALKSERI